MLVRLLIVLAPALLFAAPALASGSAHGAEGDHGIPWGPILQHAVNLLLLLGFLGFVLRKRIPEALRARRAGVAKDISDAAEARSEAQAKFDALEAKLAGFEAQIAEMKAETQHDAAAERELILAKADAAATAIDASAERTIAGETHRARQALRADAARLAVELAAQQIRAGITAQDDLRLTTDFLAALKGADSTDEVTRG